MAIILPRVQAVSFNSQQLSDHNRSEISVNFERIEERRRMANGRLRTYFTANKETWSWSWDMLPGNSSNTVDGKMGADALEAFYLSNNGPFTFTITQRPYRSGDLGYNPSVKQDFVVSHQVIFSDFSKNLQKRFDDYYWAVSVAVERV